MIISYHHHHYRHHHQHTHTPPTPTHCANICRCEQTETGPPQFLDERHWGLFYELLAHSPIKTIPLRTEMLRVISSALLCCVGLASAEAGVSAANQAQILSLSANERLAIVKRLEAVVQLLSSTYSQFFTPAMDNYVSFVCRVSQALIHLYVRLDPGSWRWVRLALLSLIHVNSATSYLERRASPRPASRAEKEMESVCVAIVATALKRFQEVKQTIETNQKKVGHLFRFLASFACGVSLTVDDDGFAGLHHRRH